MTDSSGRVLSWVVPQEAGGQRLDLHVAARLDQPRSRIQGWIERGLVVVGSGPARASTRVHAGDLVEVQQPPAPTDDRVVPESGEIGTVLHLDEDLLAVDKPAGLVVHPGAGRAGGTLANALLARFPEIAGVGGPGRPGIVHRLDRDTSGVLLVARTDRAYRALSTAFAERRVEKTYLALLWGPIEAAFERRDAIGRHPTERQRMAVRPGGRPAVSRFDPCAAASGVVACVVAIETGRTHQIRVHAKASGHPLVGDPLYGEARHRGLQPGPAARALAVFPRPALHAWSLELDHPVSGARLEITAPVPTDLVELWRTIGGAPLPVRPPAPSH